MEQGSSRNPTPLDYARPGLSKSLLRSQLSRIIFWTISLTVIGVLVSVLVPNGPRHQPNYLARCSMNLKAIGSELWAYANAHGGAYPASLKQLLLDPGVSIESFNFACPESDQDASPAKTGAQLANDLTSNPTRFLSYVYCGAGLTISSPPDVVLAYEPPGNHSAGINVLYADGHVDFVQSSSAAKCVAELKAGHNPPRAEMIK